MSNSKQAQDSEIDCLHHVGHIVQDIDEGVALYRRLGFLPTAPNYYVLASEGAAGQAIGPVNAYSTMTQNFIEIVSVAKPGAAPRTGEPQVINVPPEQREVFAARLAQAGDTIDVWRRQFEGLHILALRTKSADETARRLTAAGVSNTGASTVNRKMETEQGPRNVPIRFLEVGAPGEDVRSVIPEGRIAIAENPDVEVLHAQKNTGQPNGALHLAEAFLYVDDADIDSVAKRYAGYLGRTPRMTEVGRVFDLGDARVTLLTRKGLRDILGAEQAAGSPAFAGYAVDVSDLEATRTLLTDNGFPIAETPAGHVLVPSAAALGANILFRAVR